MGDLGTGKSTDCLIYKIEILSRKVLTIMMVLWAKLCPSQIHTWSPNLQSSEYDYIYRGDYVKEVIMLKWDHLGRALI